ncbi:MAG: ABC transporter substrate-binding protein [Vulcanimicrobiaceae bacterium]
MTRSQFAQVAAPVATALTLAPSGLLRAAGTEDVKLALNWLVSGRNSPFFVGVDKGYYAAEGLNVSISRGNGSGDTVKRIAVGESLFGLADTATVIAAQANDSAPVTIVGMINGKSSVAIVYSEQSGIRKPQDLVGKTLGRSAAGASVNMYPGFLAVNHIDRNSIKEVVAPGSAFEPLLFSKKVDAVLDQSSYLGRYRKDSAAQNIGITLKAFRFADYGFDLYGDSIIVNNDALKSKPDIIRRFMTATIKAALWSYEHPADAIAILRKTNPEVEADIGEAELQDAKELSITPETAAHGYGYVDSKHMEHVRDVVTEALKLKRKIPVGEIFTDADLPVIKTANL